MNKEKQIVYNLEVVGTHDCATLYLIKLIAKNIQNKLKESNYRKNNERETIVNFNFNEFFETQYLDFVEILQKENLDFVTLINNNPKGPIIYFTEVI